MKKKEQDVKIWPTEEVNRALFKNAPYNPRFITAKNRKKLKANLIKSGLMGGIIWNKRTGNLVGGHQRISIIDQIKGTQDYTLPVTVVDLSLEEEKAQNVALNNTELQGQYEENLLKSLLSEFTEEQTEQAGFIETDILQMFGENIQKSETEEYKEACERAEKAKEVFDIANRMQKVQADNFYVVLVWKEAKERAVCLAQLGFNDNKFIAANDFIRALKDKYGTKEA